MSFSLKVYLASLLLLVGCHTKAQGTNVSNNIDIKLETSGTFSDGDYAPFWMINNNYGIGSEKNNQGYIRVGTFADKSLFNNKLNINIGADIIASHNLQTDFYFHQLYVDLKHRSLGMSIGVKERDNPFKNKYLSTGGLTLSNNARPIPQVEAGFPEFVNIPLTNEWVQIQGGISYGRFLDNKYKIHHAEDGDYAKNILYHRKYAYFKIEKQYPLSFVLGLEMDAQWGGKMYRNGEYFSESPGNLKNFFKILIPMAGGGDSNGTDQVNVVGNVYGSWHFIFNYKKKDYSIKAYYEHFFEDHSGMFFKSMPDGVYGIEFNLNKKHPISSILFEWVYTKNQSGPFLWDESSEIPIQVSAGDNYYNHIDYISLTNYGNVLGNPLLTSPIYNKRRTLKVLNSRISAFHGGISGFVTNDLRYRALATYSRSWGTPFIPSKDIKNQFSSMLEMTYNNAKLNGWMFSGALAYDNSATMVGDNFGVKFKVTKTFSVK